MPVYSSTDGHGVAPTLVIRAEQAPQLPILDSDDLVTIGGSGLRGERTRPENENRCRSCAQFTKHVSPRTENLATIVMLAPFEREWSTLGELAYTACGLR